MLALDFFYLLAYNHCLQPYQPIRHRYNSLKGNPIFKTFSVDLIFYLSFISGSTSEFVLRPEGSYLAGFNACVKADSPLSLMDCGASGSEPDEVRWMAKDGKIVSKKDMSQCITHNLSSNSADATGCGTDIKSYVSIIPAIGFFGPGVHAQIEGAFPQAGIRK